jgi:A/G-specific adenine glycosylase
MISGTTQAKSRKKCAKSIEPYRITRPLLKWYNQKGRSLPWRNTTDPYQIWVAEIMLQQTQVKTVIPYYHRFLNLFPTVYDLANASSGEVLKAWENLGYYSRALNLHRAAIMVVNKFGGRLPRSCKDLLALPGIGTYTAGAILSIAFGQPTIAIDANVRRVLSRLFAIKGSSADREAQKRLQAVAEELIATAPPGSFNQALMDLGATVCLPENPFCSGCVLGKVCMARMQGLQVCLPQTTKRSHITEREAVAALIKTRGNKILVLRRPEKGLLASLWKLPGGFRREGETLADSLHRTVMEETGLRIRVKSRIASIRHAYTHFRLRLHAYLCSIDGSALIRQSVPSCLWITPSEIALLPMSKADRIIIERSMERMHDIYSKRQKKIVVTTELTHANAMN